MELRVTKHTVLLECKGKLLGVSLGLFWEPGSEITLHPIQVGGIARPGIVNIPTKILKTKIYSNFTIQKLTHTILVDSIMVNSPDIKLTRETNSMNQLEQLPECRSLT